MVRCVCVGGGGGVYCKRCCKLAAVTAEPLQFGEDGKHVGLFWGRYDEPRPVFSGGFLCVQWKSDECKAIVDAALKEGKTWHHSIYSYTTLLTFVNDCQRFKMIEDKWCIKQPRLAPAQLKQGFCFFRPFEINVAVTDDIVLLAGTKP